MQKKHDYITLGYINHSNSELMLCCDCAESEELKSDDIRDWEPIFNTELRVDELYLCDSCCESLV